MSLAAVRTISSPRALRTAEEVEDFEQEIVKIKRLSLFLQHLIPLVHQSYLQLEWILR